MSNKPTDASVARSLDDLLARDGADFVRAAYRTLLRRDPDPGGLVAYLTRLNQGVSKQQLLDELRASPEGRSCDVRLDGWVGMPGMAPGEDALDRLLCLRGETFVRQAYRLLLDREADAEGLRFYSQQIERGVAAGRVLAEIASSDEYLRRNKPVPGLQQFIRRHRPLQQPLAQKLLRLLRPGKAVTADLPSTPLPPPATTDRAAGPAPLADPAEPRARPLNPARAILTSLPEPQWPASTSN
ncbi:MAG: DUF4214 domain-containing protein [Burkholderiaceae bacterium]|nr:DUF4214 domain-containing protein [Burkholderiaceae bacterium]